MSNRNAVVVNLGPDSFFHFGTPNELLTHFLDESSIFYKKILSTYPICNLQHSIASESHQVV